VCLLVNVLKINALGVVPGKFLAQINALPVMPRCFLPPPTARHHGQRHLAEPHLHQPVVPGNFGEPKIGRPVGPGLFWEPKIHRPSGHTNFLPPKKTGNDLTGNSGRAQTEVAVRLGKFWGTRKGLSRKEDLTLWKKIRRAAPDCRREIVGARLSARDCRREIVGARLSAFTRIGILKCIKEGVFYRDMN
jgi:hypothetical protein